MSSSDGVSETRDQSRQRRKRRNSSLLVLAAGFLLFCAAGGTLYYALRAVTLRIAVGPPGSDDQRLIEALAQSFDLERRAIRLSPIMTDGAVESLGLLGAGKADLASDIVSWPNVRLVSIRDPDRNVIMLAQVLQP